MSKPKNIDKEVRTFRLDSDTLKQIEALAHAENRTVNNMVETILKKTVSSKAKQYAAI